MCFNFIGQFMYCTVLNQRSGMVVQKCRSKKKLDLVWVFSHCNLLLAFWGQWFFAFLYSFQYFETFIQLFYSKLAQKRSARKIMALGNRSESWKSWSKVESLIICENTERLTYVMESNWLWPCLQCLSLSHSYHCWFPHSQVCHCFHKKIRASNFKHQDSKWYHLRTSLKSWYKLTGPETIESHPCPSFTSNESDNLHNSFIIKPKSDLLRGSKSWMFTRKSHKCRAGWDSQNR